MRSDAFVTSEWLVERLEDPTVRIVDGSWHMSSSPRDPRAEYAAVHLPGAVFFDIDGLSDKQSRLPHMLPSAAAFADAISALGISNSERIIVYDSVGLLSAPRVWWTFRVFGHRDVFILDGGLPKWRRENRPVASGIVTRPKATFEARYTPNLVSDLDRIQTTVGRVPHEDALGQVVDARSAGRFEGTAPEPRPGLRSGHIPSSRNLPYTALIADGRLKDEADLRAAFTEAGVDLAQPVHATCGSGMTAAIVALARFTLGYADTAIYDGSWTEWGGRDDTPIETGPARPT